MTKCISFKKGDSESVFYSNAHFHATSNGVSRGGNGSPIKYYGTQSYGN